MKIKTKIVVWFLTLSFLVAVVGNISVNALNSIEEEFSIFEQHTVSQMETFGSIKGNIHMSLINLNSYVITGDEEFKKLTLNHLKKAEESQERYNNIPNVEFATDIKDADNKIKSQILELIGLYESGASEKTMLDKSNEIVKIRKETMMFYHDNIDIHLEKDRKDTTNALFNKFNETKVIIISLSVITFLVAIIMGLFISTSISNPLNRFTKAVKDISKGNFNVTVDRKLKLSNDEIGELARAFDRTIVSLKLAMKNAENASENVGKEEQ